MGAGFCAVIIVVLRSKAASPCTVFHFACKWCNPPMVLVAGPKLHLLLSRMAVDIEIDTSEKIVLHLGLNAIITRTSRLYSRITIVMPEEQVSERLGWSAPDLERQNRTFRNRTTMGSSFRSSLSRAATSIEYTRKVFLTSAACTDI